MARVRWTLGADREFTNVLHYLEQLSPSYADSLGIEVYEALDRVGTFPLSGRVVPDLADEDVREVLVDDYRIVYQLLEGDVVVVAVLHGSRRFPADFVNRLEDV